MTGNQERELIKKVYPNRTWASKVDRMSDGQVHAIYMSFKNKRRI